LEDNVQIDLRQIECCVMDLTEENQDEDQRRASVHGNKRSDFLKFWETCDNCVIGGLSRRPQPSME
jgi:hypothetical protein